MVQAGGLRNGPFCRGQNEVYHSSVSKELADFGLFSEGKHEGLWMFGRRVKAFLWEGGFVGLLRYYLTGRAGLGENEGSA
jgi:hypothetical protein